MKNLLVFALVFLKSLSAAAAPPAADAAAKKQWEQLTEAIRPGMEGYLHDHNFTDEQNQALVVQFEKAIALLNSHPGVVANIVQVSNEAALALRVVKATKFVVTTARANAITDTALVLANGAEVRVDVLEGQWSTSPKTDKWPLNPGTGYPSYVPGAFINFQLCKAVAMGAIIVNTRPCIGAGTWARYSGADTIARLQMNDTELGDNIGQLKVRVGIRTGVSAADIAAIERPAPAAREPAAASDGRGHVWTPDGTYANKQTGVNAVLDSSSGKGTLDAGNGCQLNGKLVAVPGTATWRFTATDADGRLCPDVPGPGAIATITTLEGPAVNAAGNARKISIVHTVPKGRISFAGEYTFVSE